MNVDSQSLVLAGVTDYGREDFSPKHRSNPALALSGAVQRSASGVVGASAALWFRRKDSGVLMCNSPVIRIADNSFRGILPFRYSSHLLPAWSDAGRCGRR